MHTLPTTVDTGNGVFHALIWFLETRGVSRVRVKWVVLYESVASTVTRPGLSVADVENATATDSVLGSDTHTGTGMKYPSAWVPVSATTDGKALFRLGLWVKNPGGTTTLQTVRVQAWAEVEEG